jgi:hypothetical protein
MGWLDYDDKKADERSSGGFSPIPIGTEISVRIKAAELRTTSTGGEMVRMTLSIVAGPHKGRQVWHNLHVVNKNAAVQHSDRRTLCNIVKVVGVSLDDPSLLSRIVGRDLMCRVAEHEENDYNGKVNVFERVDSFRTDPDANNTPPSGDFDDDDIPF